MSTVQLRVQRLDPDLPLPSYAHFGDAGLDLVAAIDVDIAPGERERIPTGIAVAIPEGFAGLVMPRSGLALRLGLSFVNTPGLIDSSYRGELVCLGINHDPHKSIHLTRGERIAQLVVLPVPPVELLEVKELEITERGSEGFGSSGV